MKIALYLNLDLFGKAQCDLIALHFTAATATAAAAVENELIVLNYTAAAAMEAGECQGGTVKGSTDWTLQAPLNN